MRQGTWTAHVTFHAEADAAATWTNMPAADTFLFGSHRHIVLFDLAGMTKVRLKVNKQATAGAALSTLTLRYSTSFSTSVGNYQDIGTAPVSVAINVTNQYLDTGWVDLNNNAMGAGDVFLSVVGNGGDGAIDPQFGVISASFS